MALRFTMIKSNTAHILAILLCLALAGTSTARADQAADQKDQNQAIFKTLRTGDWHLALSMLQAYNLSFAGDSQMLYNQACLENRAGDQRQSLATLRLALAAGFDEMGFALQDPDLKGVADDPKLFDLDTRTRSDLLQTSSEKHIDMDNVHWSAPVTLTTPDSHTPAPSIRLAWRARGLEIEMTTPAPWDDYISSGLPPWAGGPGLILTLVVPDSSASFSGGNSFSFALGSEKGGPTAAQFLPGPNHWQRLVEMSPKVNQDKNGNPVLTAIIPWLAIMPFHPLVDPVLGLNVQVRRDSAHGYAKAVLMPDPWAWAPAALSHRFIPLNFHLDSSSGELFMGRVSDSIGGDEPLDLRFSVFCPTGGQGRLTLNFLDPATNSVLPGGPHAETVTLKRGLNTLVRQADFRGLQSGAYLIRAGLRFPSGRDATWSTSILQLAEGWRQDLENRITQVPDPEKPTLRRMLDAVLTALPTHLTRRSPGPIATTLQDMHAMLNQDKATGSILPDQGPVTLVYPGPEGEDRLCTLYLTAPADSLTGIEPVLVLQQAAGHEGFLVDRIARNHEHGDLKPAASYSKRPVYIIPNSPRNHLTESEAEQEADTCLQWVLDFLGTDQALAVGIGPGAGPALRLAQQNPQLIKKLLVFDGRDLNPWPHATAADIAANLSPAPATPVTWLEFPLETNHRGQGPEILDQLKNTGWQIDDVGTVRGGLSLSQAADRMVLWVTESPVPGNE